VWHRIRTEPVEAGTDADPDSGTDTDHDPGTDADPIADAGAAQPVAHIPGDEH
jgi:hypothetical protein